MRNDRQDLWGGVSKLLSIGSAACLAGCVVLSPTPATHNFGSVLVGTTATSPPVTWTNNSARAVTVDGLVTTPSPPFARVAAGPFTSVSVPVGGATPPSSFTFSPTAVGAATGDATPQSTGIVLPDTAQQVVLSGTGVVQLTAGALAIAGGNLTAGQILDFGRVIVPGGPAVTRTFNVTNNGAASLTLNGGFTVGGQGFRITSPTLPITIQPGTTQAVSISFAPSQIGVALDAVVFSDSTGANQAGTTVSGEGIPGG